MVSYLNGNFTETKDTKLDTSVFIPYASGIRLASFVINFKRVNNGSKLCSVLGQYRNMTTPCPSRVLQAPGSRSQGHHRRCYQNEFGPICQGAYILNMNTEHCIDHNYKIRICRQTYGQIRRGA